MIRRAVFGFLFVLGLIAPALALDTTVTAPDTAPPPPETAPIPEPASSRPETAPVVPILPSGQLPSGADQSTLGMDRPLTDEEIQLIQKINAHNTDIRSMAGRFVQIDSDGNRSEGSFYLVRPDKIAFRYAPPSRERIVSVGQGFYLLDTREKTKKIYPQNQIPLRQFLADKIDLFNANIKAVALTTGYASITISDNTPMGSVDVAMIFDRKTNDLVQWTLTEPNGGQLTFSLYDVVQNIEIPKAFFYIDNSYKSVGSN